MGACTPATRMTKIGCSSGESDTPTLCPTASKPASSDTTPPRLRCPARCPDTVLGPFVGYNYFTERWGTRLRPDRKSSSIHRQLPPAHNSAHRHPNSTWNSLRVGLTGDDESTIVSRSAPMLPICPTSMPWIELARTTFCCGHHDLFSTRRARDRACNLRRSCPTT